MFGITDVWAYALTALVLILLPGPNSMFCLSIASTLGAKKARFAILGTFLGNGTLIVASAAGAGTLLQLYPALFGVLKAVGAMYLAYLGVRLFYDAMRAKTSQAISDKPTANVQIFKKALWVALLNPKGLLFFPSMMVQFVVVDLIEQPTANVQIFKKALWVALLNPKGLLFFPSMMVQFVVVDYAYPVLSFAILGAIFQSISLLFLLTLAQCAALVITYTRKFALLAKVGKTAVGAMFMYFAVRLVS